MTQVEARKVGIRELLRRLQEAQEDLRACQEQRDLLLQQLAETRRRRLVLAA